jgi:hypothetical protein
MEEQKVDLQMVKFWTRSDKKINMLGWHFENLLDYIFL